MIQVSLNLDKGHIVTVECGAIVKEEFFPQTQYDVFSPFPKLPIQIYWCGEMIKIVNDTEDDLIIHYKPKRKRKFYAMNLITSRSYLFLIDSSLFRNGEPKRFKYELIHRIPEPIQGPPQIIDMFEDGYGVET